jgi:hypothetical protein
MIDLHVGRQKSAFFVAQFPLLARSALMLVVALAGGCAEADHSRRDDPLPVLPFPGVAPMHDAQGEGRESADMLGGSSDVPTPPALEEAAEMNDVGLVFGPAPSLRNSVALADDVLARQVLELMGSAAVGAQGSCSNCHSIGRPTLTRWQRLTDQFSDACLGDTTLTDVKAVDLMVDCFQAHSQPATSFSPPVFGIYAAAAHLPWFSFVFEHASEYAADGQALHADFVTRVGMPRSGAPLTQAQFDLVAEWFARGLPGLFDLVPEDSGAACTPGLDPRVRAHVADMAKSGWRARNAQVPLLMFGCESGQAPAQCLGQVPLASAMPFGQRWDVPGGARIRILSDNTSALSTYWSRSSADGRYIASGLLRADASGNSGQFLDLLQGRRFSGDFSYDPTFFPDNSGFVVQRAATPASRGAPAQPNQAVVCNQSVLAGNANVITGEESACTQTDQVGLYQQVARSVEGDDYWLVAGSFESDDGGFSAVLANPAAAFETRSTVTLTPMLNTGATFQAGTATTVATPLEGDPMLSPSGRLLVTRLKGRETTTGTGRRQVVTAEQSGYALRLLTPTRSDGSLAASLADLGRICIQGGKAVVSYDERWMVIYHYVTANDAVELGYSGPDDPAFADYLTRGASNLILVDLLDGSSHLITHMDPGQYALYPHFRSDGWLYFVVRTLDRKEYFAATDAAVLLENATLE